jgi:hypothetical protein
VKRDPLEELYASKCDDELLILAAEEASLREEAKQILADELRRRNLDGQSASTINLAATLPSHLVNKALSRAKWLGLWLLTTFIATFGTAINIGIISYSLQPFISRDARIHFVHGFVDTPYYPLPILIALLIGFFSYVRFRGTYRYWVWILPAVVVVRSLVDWKQSNQASWADSLMHFFGFITYPANRDQLDSTLFLYMSLAYVAGVLVHAFAETTVWFPSLRRRFRQIVL